MASSSKQPEYAEPHEGDENESYWPDDADSLAAEHRLENPLAAYLAWIGGFSILPDSEQRALARRIQARDEAAKRRLVETNLRLVVPIAAGYEEDSRDPSVSLLDRIQEGNIGLIRAAGLYDPDHESGAQFGTYATPWVRQAISRAITEKARAVRITEYAEAGMRQVARAKRSLRAQGIARPSHQAIGSQIGGVSASSVYELEWIRHTLWRMINLDGPLEGLDDSDDDTNEAITPDPSATVPIDAAEQNVGLRGILNILSSTDRAIVMLRAGLVDDAEWPLMDIARVVGLSYSNTRLHHMQAMQRLRTHCREAGYKLEDYL